MWPFRRRRAEAGATSAATGAAATPPAPPIDKDRGDPAARHLRTALERRDWVTARDFLNTVTHPDDRAFYLGICAGVDDVQDWIEEWIKAEPHSTLPLLVRGCHAVYWAWEARGGATASNTSQRQFEGFFDRLRLAENCLDEVVERDPDDTTAWTFLVTSARGRQVGRDEAMHRFDQVVRRHPTHQVAHQQMLQFLCRKWSGSTEEMFDFARTAAEKAPVGSLLPELVVVAHIEHWLDLPSEEKDPYIMSPQVRAELRAAAGKSIWHPDYRRRPGWPSPFNSFALAFSFAEDYPAAAAVFDVIGDRVTDWPWYYSSGRDPAGRFATWRDIAIANRHEEPQ
ncbi:DUF4034 domain-containing protein [Plantactinospora sp. B5E13]|uniref:DUF4034 domain-containing protein n=1 Tax=unclassified Plantactinospora TaxID=2631981 RepID=UPI00325F406E